MSRLASSRMMFGDLPPSSSVTFFKVPAPSCMMRRPTSVEPGEGDLADVGMRGELLARPSRPDR